MHQHIVTAHKLNRIGSVNPERPDQDPDLFPDQHELLNRKVGTSIFVKFSRFFYVKFRAKKVHMTDNFVMFCFGKVRTGAGSGQEL